LFLGSRSAAVCGAENDGSFFGHFVVLNSIRHPPGGSMDPETSSE